MSTNYSADRFAKVEQHLRDNGIRLTAQRQLIVKRAVSYLHFTAEGLVKAVRSADPTISRGTVYRVLGLLQHTGVVEKHDFLYGPPNYEVTFGKPHHDHLMCVQCGEIIEYQEPRVEEIQEEVVRRFGYKLLSHTHKLYGVCTDCQAKAGGRRVVRDIPRLHVEAIVR